MPTTNSISAIAAAKQLLDSHPDYKVIRRIQPRTEFAKSEGGRLARGVVVDTETTGLDFDKDAIIELGMILFEYDPETGIVYRVLETFDQLEDPGFPIAAASTDVHGITDEMVAGKMIDDGYVEQFLGGVSLVIAHNAKFDRVFLEKRLPIFKELPWGCSIAQVDWSGEGVGSAKLEYIAYQYGMFYEAHRAEEDCVALLEVLQQKLPKSGEIVLRSILKALNQTSFIINATKSAFETKDILKSRGYRWDGVTKCWYTNVNGDDALAAEAAWLKTNVYAGKSAKIEIEEQNGINRFSSRAGIRTFRVI